MIRVRSQEAVDADRRSRRSLEEGLVRRWVECLRPFHMPMDLDSETEAGPLERMKVLMRAAHLVVAFGWPVPVLQSESGCKERRLRGVGVFR